MREERPAARIMTPSDNFRRRDKLRGSRDGTLCCARSLPPRTPDLADLEETGSGTPLAAAELAPDSGPPLWKRVWIVPPSPRPSPPGEGERTAVSLDFL